MAMMPKELINHMVKSLKNNRKSIKKSYLKKEDQYQNQKGA